jgi:uncharacterized phage protein (TIGR01671 family)
MVNREIRFRAFDKTRKTILQNCDIIFNHTGSVFCDFDDGLVVKDFILMQYTGLKDCNGKEIYEGDIVKWSSVTLDNDKDIPAGIGWVKFHPKYLRFDVGYMDEFKSEFNGTLVILSWVANAGLKIIGNLYENPDESNLKISKRGSC